MSYLVTMKGNGDDREQVEIGNQFFLIRGLLLGTMTIGTTQAIKAWDEIEAYVAALKAKAIAGETLLKRSRVDWVLDESMGGGHIELFTDIEAWQQFYRASSTPDTLIYGEVL